MNSKISSLLLLQDEQFLSMMKDERKRRSQLEQLYGFRANGLIVSFIILVVLIIAISTRWQDSLLATLSFLWIGVMLGYLNIDSKIRTIRLYELLRALAPRS